MSIPTIAITKNLATPGQFWEFNREERNAVSNLVGLLGQGDNLAAFAAAFGWSPPDLAEAETSVEWTFLRDLWSHHSRAKSGDELRGAILDGLQPPNRDSLASCSFGEFDTYFGAVPRPSNAYVQSPGNWSIARFDPNIEDNAEFLRTCRFKWAFNIKPDLVLQTPSGQVLCVEAKWDSAEGLYPASEAEKSIFRRRGLAYVTQTDIQRYLVNEVLGFTGTFAYLARREITTAAGTAATWADVLTRLDRSGAPKFIQDWCDREIEGHAASSASRGHSAAKTSSKSQDHF